MSNIVEGVSQHDKKMNEKINQLLEQEGISRDKNLDYTCVIADDYNNPIATGSCFGNTLRCMAVDHSHQGEGLLNEVVLHLIHHLFEIGITHLFLYTKITAAPFFEDLGFSEIARVSDKLVFMENRKNGFSNYLKKLKQECTDEILDGSNIAGAVVMNANPFTKGHLYLIEEAVKKSDVLHVFVVDEDCSSIPFGVRWDLVKKGTSHLNHLVYHQTGSYMISQATFPSYFLKEEKVVCKSQAMLDVAVFEKIADELGIGVRFVGEEPTSIVTGVYNQVMRERLLQHGIKMDILTRKAIGNQAISASTVRSLIHDGNVDAIHEFVPDTTWEFFKSEAALPVIQSLQREESVVHY